MAAAPEDENVCLDRHWPDGENFLAYRQKGRGLIGGLTPKDNLTRRRRVRCGNKRAIVALGHTLLITIHAVLSTRSPYREAPLTDETERQEERARYHLRCLKKLGYTTLAPE